MKCPFDDSSCDKPKVLSVIRMLDGKKQELNVCADCVHKIKVGHEDLFEMISPLMFDIPSLDDSLNNPICKCGMTLFELSKNGRLGCAECYTTFNDILMPTIKRCCKNPQHKGKFPKKLRTKREIECLQEEMELVVQDENYERAAAIRDRLKELKDLK